MFATHGGNGSKNKSFGKDCEDKVIEVPCGTVVIVEYIVYTGVTMKHLLETLQARKPKEIRIATLLLKPDKLKVELDIHYVAMRIPVSYTHLDVYKRQVVLLWKKRSCLHGQLLFFVFK